MSDPMLIAQLAVNGLLLAGVYALMALGLNVIFGVVRVLNLAHGEVLMIGAFAAARAAGGGGAARARRAGPGGGRAGAPRARAAGAGPRAARAAAGAGI